MIRIFWENQAMSPFIIYHCLTLCQKSKKSLERFSVTFANGRTHGRTFPGLTSPGGENCNAGNLRAQRQYVELTERESMKLENPSTSP